MYRVFAKPVYLLSVVSSLFCQFVGRVDNLLCLSLYLVFSRLVVC